VPCRARPFLLLAVSGSACLLDAAAAGAAARADVVAVEVRGRAGAYQFLVTLKSPDQSCDRYADWWEVVREDGSLAYRRILRHSHPDEQPFTRAGGPVRLERDQVIVVRGHLHPAGYGGVAFRGSVAEGFARWKDPPADFAAELGEREPLPRGCLH